MGSLLCVLVPWRETTVRSKWDIIALLVYACSWGLVSGNDWASGQTRDHHNGVAPRCSDLK